MERGIFEIVGTESLVPVEHLLHKRKPPGLWVVFLPAGLIYDNDSARIYAA